MGYVVIALFWVLAIWAFMSRGPALLYLYFGSIAFGSTAVIPTELTGGLTIIPLWAVALLLVARTLIAPGGPDFYLTNGLRANRLGLLVGYLVVATVVTIFMPRLFAGDVMVVGMREAREGLVPLGPTAANFSQLGYVIMSALAVFAFVRMLRTRADRQHALNAMCFGAFVLVLTGVLDFASTYVPPLKAFLDSLRTASYAMATDVFVLEGKRVVGMMPEASAFGFITLSFLSALVFFRRTIADSKVRNIYAPLLIGALALLIYLSTSSGALVGLAVLACVVAAEAVLRAFSRGQARQIYRQDLVGEVVVVLGLMSTVGFVLLLWPETLQPVYELVDRMVLTKTESGSFEERGAWRAASWDALFSTYGLGVGMGSTRASSTVVAIFSNAGVLGGLLFFGFILRTMLHNTRHLPWEGQAMMSAFRFSFIAPFVVSTMVGGVQLSGIQMFTLGLAVALVSSREARYAKYRMREDQSLANFIRLRGQGVPQLAPPEARPS